MKPYAATTAPFRVSLYGVWDDAPTSRIVGRSRSRHRARQCQNKRARAIGRRALAKGAA